MKYDYIYNLTQAAYGGNRVGKQISLGLFIREHLQERGPTGDYPSNIFRAWRSICLQDPKVLTGERKPIYASKLTIYSMMSMLAKLGFVKRIRQVETKDLIERTIHRSYYAIVPNRISDRAWLNVRVAYDNMMSSRHPTTIYRLNQSSTSILP